ncbi:MAG TPA: TldD/PmbA family protein [Gemmatimonadaceae bacterium]|nr:TldD/PmbA family protein [Gemmatimonadaceae bacterium]
MSAWRWELGDGRPRLPSDARVLTREQSQELIERAIKFSKADSIQVNLGGGYAANVRFADNRISTAGGVATANLTIQSSFGPKHSVVSTNDFTDAGLERAVRQSEALAKLAPDDPEAMPPLGPQQYENVTAYFDSTANLGPEGRAEAARVAIDPCRAAGDLKAAGFLQTGIGAGAVGNSAGLFAYQSGTSTNYTLTVRTADGTGSGWAGADHPDWSQLDVKGVAQRAIDKARSSRNPVAIEPGRYTVILEPQAVGDLVQLLAFSLSARAADEGRSAFSKPGGGTKIGEKITDERVTLFADPADPQLLSNTFDGQGLPSHRVVWIENGVLKRLTYGRFWAKKKNQEPDAGTNAVKLAGGTQTTEELIASTPRGVLVTRLFYLRQVDPRTVLYTGLTRDGTFLIENGKVSKSIKNFRFNESPLLMLNNLEGLGRAERVAGTESGGDVVMPSLKIRDFNFTSLSDAV